MTDAPRHGGIFFVRRCIFLAHAGHIRAYLHGMQPGNGQERVLVCRKDDNNVLSA